jgi:glycosyltransferase involved in cell wall biosynthesis
LGRKRILSRTIALLLPTLNEIDGLTKIFHTIDQSLFEQILIVDGGSTDGTVEFATKHAIPMISQARPGLGFAVLDAIKLLKTDCVIEFSLDGNCLVDQLPEICKKLREGFDLVVVSRYLPPAISYDDSFITGFGNWMFTRLIRGLGKFPATDALTMYRGFDCKIIQFPEFEKLLYGPVFEPLVSAIAGLRNLKTCEIPGDEPKRIGGISKMSVSYNGSCILLMIVRAYLLATSSVFVKTLKRFSSSFL